MLFLDADYEWILARDRRELIDALLEHVDPNDDDHLLPRLAAACLEYKEEEVMWVEK